jgi:hypothetical protein
MSEKNMKSKSLLSPSRRRFLSGLALGAGAAPFLALSQHRTVGARETEAASLCFSNKRVLGPADFRYLGAMRVPAANVDMSQSQGLLTGRRVDGRVQLLMVGGRNIGDPVYEFADAGSYHADPAQAPRMPLVRNWGNVYGTARKSWTSTGEERLGAPDDPYRYMGALHYNAATDLLYWSYYDAYNVARIEDWCLGATRLSTAGPVAFGPWRPSGGDRKGPWRCISLAQHPVTGELLCGSRLLSGNIGSPWGPDLWAGPFPTSNTPSGFGAPDISVQKYLTYYPMIGSINADGSYQGPQKTFRRPGDYLFEPIVGDATLTTINPLRNGGVGSWTDLDTINGAAWLDLPDAHGVVFIGKLASEHVWYRSVGQGNVNCTHGVASPIDVTGPVSTDAYPVMVFYDPRDLDAVRVGSRVDYTIEPTSIVNAQSRFGLATAPIREVGTAKSLGGCYFDQPTRKLYVAAAQADPTIGGLLNPLVHVFQVA